MRRRTSRAAVVTLALAAPLVLSSAGQGSDADASGESQDAAAAVCRAVPASNAQWNIDQHINGLVASGETAGAPDVVVLNSQGYNYGRRAVPQHGALQPEAALRRQR